MLHFLYWPDDNDPRLPPERLARELAALADAGFACSPLPAGVLARRHALKGVPQGAVVVYRGPMLSWGDYEQLERAIVEVGARPFTTFAQYQSACRLSAWHEQLAPWCTPMVPVANWRDLPAVAAQLTWPVAQLWSETGPVLDSRGLVRPADLTDADEARLLREDVQQSLPAETLAAGLYWRLPASDEQRVDYLVLQNQAYAADDGAIPTCVERAAAAIKNPFFVVEVSLADPAAPRIARIIDGQVAEVFGWPPDRLAKLWKRIANGE